MLKKIFRWITNIFIIFLIFIVTLSFYSVIKARRNLQEIPSILGYKPMSVLSGSMRPSLEPGDMIVVKEIKPEDVNKGDVITFRMDSDSLVTHRVVEVLNQGKEIKFRTRGDANNTDDSNLVSSKQLIGILAFNIPKGGYIANFIRSPFGFIFLILIPIIYLIASELKKTLSELKNSKNDNPKKQA